MRSAQRISAASLPSSAAFPSWARGGGRILRMRDACAVKSAGPPRRRSLRFSRPGRRGDTLGACSLDPRVLALSPPVTRPRPRAAGLSGAGREGSGPVPGAAAASPAVARVLRDPASLPCSAVRSSESLPADGAALRPGGDYTPRSVCPAGLKHEAETQGPEARRLCLVARGRGGSPPRRRGTCRSRRRTPGGWHAARGGC